MVIGPYLNERTRSGATGRSAQARIEEAAGLAAAIEVEIVDVAQVMLSAVRPSTFLGKGKVGEFAARVAEEEVELVIMDCALSPIQQRNLEKALSAKVIDRTGLILEIFGRRARTREGALQVELAHLAYQKSRLVRSWTHLERQRGGFGFLGGPGETQIETDRRLIQERMARIEYDLEKVKRTRGLHRKSRRDVPYPVVALVGYTNAGKSTLFNRLTSADVFAQDMLFATLDPTLRAVTLAHGAKIILSDTVGFISDLPLTLVSAFRATLEEVLEADLILHVRDVAHEDAEHQRADVEAILDELGIESGDGRRILEVWNKADLLDEQAHEAAKNAARRGTGHGEIRPMLVSALTGAGLDELRAQIEARLSGERLTFQLELKPENGAGLHWLYENAEILRRSSDAEGNLHMKVRVGPERAELIRRYFLFDERGAPKPPSA